MILPARQFTIGIWVAFADMPFHTLGTAQSWTRTMATADYNMIRMQVVFIWLAALSPLWGLQLLLILLLLGQIFQFNATGRNGPSFGQVTALGLLVAIALGDSRHFNVVTVGHRRVLAIWRLPRGAREEKAEFGSEKERIDESCETLEWIN